MTASPPHRVVVITGAGSGIGLAAALEYARHGWGVGLIGRGEAALADAARQVAEAGGTPLIAVADVSDSTALEAAAGTIESGLGPIEVWVNNAGIGFYGKFADVPETAFRRVLDVNLHGAVNGTRAALARMVPRDRGTIVQVLSAIAYRGVPLQSAYSASKYGLRGFTEAVRAELAHDRSAIHVTMVHPPAVNTPFYSHAGSVMRDAPRPPPPIYQPEIIGEAIYLAGTQRRREWRVTEEAVAFSVANKIVPGLLDRLSGRFGVAVQHTARAEVAERRDPNTFTPSTRPAGTHGPFDSESLRASPGWWISKNPLCAGLAAAALGVGVLSLAARKRR